VKPTFFFVLIFPFALARKYSRLESWLFAGSLNRYPFDVFRGLFLFRRGFISTFFLRSGSSPLPSFGFCHWTFERSAAPLLWKPFSIPHLVFGFFLLPHPTPRCGSVAPVYSLQVTGICLPGRTLNKPFRHSLMPNKCRATSLLVRPRAGGWLFAPETINMVSVTRSYPLSSAGFPFLSYITFWHFFFF